MPVRYGSLPFAEALAFLRAKLNLPTEHWDDLLGAAHDRAFVVAGATKADLLSDLRLAVEKAIGEGQTLRDFRKNFEQIVADRGWTGWTGEGSKAGRAWRARVIYDTNLFTSYSAGRYRQMKAVAEKRPYWRYRHSPASVVPRAEHLAWDGMILRHDDPWWQTHQPPNGFGCKCFVETLAERDLKKHGLAVTPDSDIPYNRDVEKVNRATGEVYTVPEGVDRGWDYAPGASTAEDLDRLNAIKNTKLRALRVTPQPKPLITAKDYQDAGNVISKTLPDGEQDPKACFDELLRRLEKEVGISTPCHTETSTGFGVKIIKQASQRYPDRWTQAADAFGPLNVKGNNKARSWHYTMPATAPAGQKWQIPEFGVTAHQDHAGYIVIRDDISTAVHEYAHRLQAALPSLDRLFQDIHHMRTAGEPLKRLRDLFPASGYKVTEVTREDKYINAYQGKEYANRGALEVMTMAFQYVLGVSSSGVPATDAKHILNFKEFYTRDRELFDFVIGVLFNWRP